MSVAKRIRELADLSTDERGGKLSLNRYVLELLRDAASRGITVELEVRSTLSQGEVAGNTDDTPSSTALAREEPGPKYRKSPPEA